jgi:hypothetical protein
MSHESVKCKSITKYYHFRTSKEKGWICGDCFEKYIVSGMFKDHSLYKEIAEILKNTGVYSQSDGTFILQRNLKKNDVYQAMERIRLKIDEFERESIPPEQDND